MKKNKGDHKKSPFLFAYVKNFSYVCTIIIKTKIMDTVIGNGEIFYLTQNKVWDRGEAYEYFFNKVSDDKLEVLFDHICTEGLAEHIHSIVEIQNDLYLNLGNGEGLIKVEYSKK